MKVSAEDKALAAYLVESRALPMGKVLEALADAERNARDLGASLVALGMLDAPAVLSLRSEMARRAYGKDSDVSDHALFEPAGERQFDEETWLDPVTALDVRATLPSPMRPRGADAWDEEGIETATRDDGDPDSVELVRPVAYPEEEETIPPSLPKAPSRRPAPRDDDTEPPGPFSPTRPLDLDRFRAHEKDVLDTATTKPGDNLRDQIERILSAPEVIDPEATLPVRPSMSTPQGVKVRSGGADDVLSDRVPSLSGAVEVDVRPIHERLTPSGKSVEERYELRGEMGRGGMGRVLKARDTEIGREVAVKVLHHGVQASENVIRRFWTEVQATGQLEHPGIIPIHDVGRLKTGELFYVMKKLTGRTFAEVLGALRAKDAAAEQEFTRARLLTIFQQIAYAVAFAHAHGVIHRDIKPANIMVGRFGEAILLDWGLAKIVDEEDPLLSTDLPKVVVSEAESAASTQSGTITGTPQYMSPEATEGLPELLTSKSDVYGLGAVLYEVLTLVPAYEDRGFLPTVMKVREGDFVSPRQRCPEADIPVELEDLCLWAMSKEADKRPRAKEIADEVGRILEGAKERERRTAEAKARVREGRRSTDRWKALKIELQSAESEAKRLAKEVPEWAEVAHKLPIWKLEDRVSELKIEAIAAFEEAEAAFLRALGEMPDDRDARSALAALYFARFGEAERARDVEGQRYYRSLVSRYDDGVWERVLEGDGTVEISADDRDVEVSLARMVSVDRRLRPTERQHLGTAPIARFDIPIGSYLLYFHRPGERDILRPLLVQRTDALQVHVRFRSSLEIGDAFVLVPEGPAIIGGDPVAHGALDRQTVDVPEFAIARFPVTCDEYLAFLNATALTNPEEAMRHVPRARAQEGHYWRFDEGEGVFLYPERSPGGHAWVGSLPVNGISMEDAQTFIAWRSSLTGERLRLPWEAEWEKAARGVDGRFFPWGDHFDPTFCKMKSSRNTRYPEPEPVGAFPSDCSPYGVRDMAGGVRELCLTETGGRVVPVMRGGCWHDTGLFCRVAFRHLTQPDFVNTGLGFRLVKDLDAI